MARVTEEQVLETLAKVVDSDSDAAYEEKSEEARFRSQLSALEIVRESVSVLKIGTAKHFL